MSSRATSQSSNTCWICEATAQALASLSREDYQCVYLASWDELLRNVECPTCACIVSEFATDLASSRVGDLRGPVGPDIADYGYCLLSWEGNTLQMRLQTDVREGASPTVSIRSLVSGSSRDHAVLIDPWWVNLDPVLEWLKECDTSHGECQQQLHTAKTGVQEMYLINLSTNCIVKATGAERYIALSYVWGKMADPYTVTKKEMGVLRTEGKLKETLAKMPGTVRRFLTLTSLLDAEYAWVDCLCIVQDDPVHAALQINQMDKIYAGSYLTVCACDGDDANGGLRGIPQTLLPRCIQQKVLKFDASNPEPEWAIHLWHTSVYATRGWTFQEEQLSHRVLKFTQSGMELKCRDSAFEERCGFMASNTDVLETLAPTDLSWPSLRMWDRLLSAYLNRSLTYDEDKLRAFAGLQNAIGSRVLGGFHFGLPESFLDAAMLWVPESPLTRQDATLQLPSWSWAGWKGLIRTQVKEFGLAHERYYSDEYDVRCCDLRRQIYPCVEWKKMSKDLEQVIIPNDYALYREDYLHQNFAEPPENWTAHVDDENGLVYYKHQHAPPGRTFWYPVPSYGNRSSPGKVWSPALNFRTRIARFNLGRPLNLELPEGDERKYVKFIHSLRTTGERWAGILYHHDMRDYEIGHEFEFAVISEGYVIESDTENPWLEEWNHDERSLISDEHVSRDASESSDGYETPDIYDFYHAICLEWQDGRVERSGLARISKDVWDSVEQETRDITLY